MRLFDTVPDSWDVVKVTEISDINPTRPDDPPDDHEIASFVPMKKIEELTGRLDPSEHKEWREIKSGYTRFQEGDVVFAKITPSMENGKAALAKNLKNGVAAGTTELHVIRPSERVLSEYLLNFVLQEGFRREAEANMTGTAGHMRVPSEFMESVEIPLPPLSEQERIVAKIEELFSKLDSGISELEDTRNQLERYRKSTLKAAMYGELTRAWRNQHLADRPTLDDQMDEYVKEVSYESDSQIDALPNQWRQVPLGSISDVIPGNSPSSDTYNDCGKGLPLINGPSEFGPKAFSKTKQTKFTTDPKKECDKDDLIVCVRGNTTGRMNIASTHSAIGRGVAAVRAYICQQYVNYYIHLKESHLLNIGTGTTYPSISSKVLRRLPIPLPTIKEQREIVEKLDRRFSILNGVGPEIDENIQRAKRLRQSILKQAFEGNLIPQKSTEEPPTPGSGDTNLEQEAQATLSEVTNNVE